MFGIFHTGLFGPHQSLVLFYMSGSFPALMYGPHFSEWIVFVDLFMTIQVIFWRLCACWHIITILLVGLHNVPLHHYPLNYNVACALFLYGHAVGDSL